MRRTDPADPTRAATLGEVAREWTRIGCTGFGGPPAHIAMLRELCVTRRRWLSDVEFEHAVAATNLLPGPGSTQLAIVCAWRVRGFAGALAGGAGFILPGLAAILLLAALFLGGPPAWVRGAGAGAGAAVAAVALRAGLDVLLPGWRRTTAADRRAWIAYVAVGAAGAALAGPRLVLVLLACGAAELVRRRAANAGAAAAHPLPLALATAAGTGGLGALCWVAFKVGALAYGGGFVIIPLMQADAVDRFGWMTDGEFLSAVALGQVTPGPVVHTVAVVGYAAAGLGGALLAALVAFAPSFAFVVLGSRRFELLRTSPGPAAFLAGAGPAAAGAITGAALPLAAALEEPWQAGVLAAGLVALFALRLGVVATLAAAGAVGAALGIAGAPLPT